MKKPSCLPLATGVSNWLSWFLPIVCVALIGAFGVPLALAQSAARDEVKSGPTASDYAAANDATLVYRHARPANTPAGAALKQKEIAQLGSSAVSAGGAGTGKEQPRFSGGPAY